MEESKEKHKNLFRVKYNVLYVEDESELITEVEAIFSTYGIQIIAAPDAKTAVTKSNNQKFDLMIFDVQLKKGSGDEAIERIRSNKQNPNYDTPIFLVSGNLDSPLIMKLKEQIQGAIVKPFGIADLAEKISAHLDSSKEDND